MPNLGTCPRFPAVCDGGACKGVQIGRPVNGSGGHDTRPRQNTVLPSCGERSSQPYGVSFLGSPDEVRAHAMALTAALPQLGLTKVTSWCGSRCRPFMRLRIFGVGWWRTSDSLICNGMHIRKNKETLVGGGGGRRCPAECCRHPLFALFLGIYTPRVPVVLGGVSRCQHRRLIADALCRPAGM